MVSNHLFEVSKMLVSLRKEEEFYKRALHHMEQEYIRLQIEELTLKAAIRQEQMKVEETYHQEEAIPNPVILSTLSENSNTDMSILQREPPNKSSESSQKSEKYYESSTQSSSSSQNGEVDGVYSNITDERYLEPLVLNPNAYGDEELIEFDD